MSTIDLFVRLLLVTNTLDNDLLNVSHKDSYKAMHTGDLVHLLATSCKECWLEKAARSLNAIG